MSMTIDYPYQNISHIFLLLWRNRKTCFLGTCIGFALFSVIGLALKPQYTVTMIVAPYEMATDFASFVDDMGYPMPQGTQPVAKESKNFIRFSQSLRGARVAGLLYRMDDIRNGVSEDGTWRGVGHALNTPENFTTYLQQQIHMEPIGVTQSLSITYRHPDPVFGVTFLKALAQANDQMIKRQDSGITQGRMMWLKEALKTSYNPEHRQALARLLLSEERRAMIFALDEPYTYQVIEQAWASGRPSVPNFLLFLPLGILFGFVGGAVIILFRERAL